MKPEITTVRSNDSYAPSSIEHLIRTLRVGCSVRSLVYATLTAMIWMRCSGDAYPSDSLPRTVAQRRPTSRY